MKKLLLCASAVLLFAIGGFAQNLTKVIVSKFENGKPELINYYKGESLPINLVKQEKMGTDGKKVLEKNFLNGKLNGQVMQWKEFDGTLETTLNYKDGLLDGPQVYFFSDGSPKVELQYQAGRLDGRQVEHWFKLGPDTLKVEHNFSGGILHGMQRQWTKSDSLVYNLNFVAGKPDGLQRFYDQSGNVREEMWRNGAFDEVITSWTPSQPRHAIVHDFVLGGDSLNITLGKEPQKEVWYLENGAIEALSTLGDFPETQVFYLGGKVKAKGAGTFEKKEGKWEFWHQNGRRMMAAEYKQGKPVGLVETWDENGKLVSEEFWNPDGSGRETWRVSQYHANGNKEWEGNLDAEGRRKGIWKYWYDNGTKKREEDWQWTCTESGGRPVLSALSVWDDAGRLVVKGTESEQQQFTYFPNGNPWELKTFVYMNRKPCEKGPLVAWDGKTFVEKVPKMAGFDDQAMIQHVTFFEGGDTMRVDEFSLEGKRQGLQRGWFSNGKPQYIYHYDKGLPQGQVKEWYASGQIMLDYKVSSEGGSPSVVAGSYFTEKAKEYAFEQGEKKKKAMEEIDAACYFNRFWQSNK